MDIAYDHIQEQALSLSEENKRQSSSNNDDVPAQPQSPGLNTEFQQAFKAVSSSQWGSTIGGWFNTARIQGETFYQDLQKEAAEAQEQATKGLSTLREQVTQRTRALSSNVEPGPEITIPGEEAVPTGTGGYRDAAAQGAQVKAEAVGQPASLPADIVKEAGSLVASLRSTAASKLRDLQKAEDAADEALLKFGTNVRNFLRDAVVISAPSETASGGKSEVLFETQEPGTATSFAQDPADNERWEEWKSGFDIDEKTDDIAKDLERYEELRKAMEKLVPEKVEYKSFWTRYYFLRQAIDEDEKRRREVLKGATIDSTEEVAWDDDEDEEQASTPNPTASNQAASASNTTLSAPAAKEGLKPKSPRLSIEDEKSVADSDASYDIVSGATSRAAGSPKEEKKGIAKGEESDDDWE